MACFLGCVVSGTTNPERQTREKIARILTNAPALAARIQSSLVTPASSDLVWSPELERFQTVVVKLARGHIAYELSLPKIEEPSEVRMMPLALMPVEDRNVFLADQPTHLLPEIGSRAFIRGIQEGADLADRWRIVQPGRYQYLVSQAAGDFVRLLIDDYLACEVYWD